MQPAHSLQVDLLTTTAAAAVLQVHPATLVNWRKAGTGPKYVRLGPRNIRYHRADLTEYLEASTVEPGASR